ncbi:MAG: hypothetical protein U0X92_02725 [Anaerolineales bacterium]
MSIGSRNAPATLFVGTTMLEMRMPIWRGRQNAQANSQNLLDLLWLVIHVNFHTNIALKTEYSIRLTEK